MQTYNLLIITPDSTLYQGEIVSAVFPGLDGFFEVLVNHAPLIACIKEGNVVITDSEKKQHSVKIKKGFFEFYKNKAIFLSS